MSSIAPPLPSSILIIGASTPTGVAILRATAAAIASASATTAPTSAANSPPVRLHAFTTPDAPHLAPPDASLCATTHEGDACSGADVATALVSSRPSHIILVLGSDRPTTATTSAAANASPPPSSSAASPHDKPPPRRRPPRPSRQRRGVVVGVGGVAAPVGGVAAQASGTDARTRAAMALVSALRVTRAIGCTSVACMSALGAGGSSLRLGLGLGRVLTYARRHALRDHDGQERALTEAFAEWNALDRLLVVRPTAVVDAPALHAGGCGRSMAGSRCRGKYGGAWKGAAGHGGAGIRGHRGVLVLADERSPTWSVDRHDLARWLVNRINGDQILFAGVVALTSKPS